MSMIEAIARALREAAKQNGSVIFGDDDTGWRVYANDARSILDAMRTPTDVMAAAGGAQTGNEGWPIGHQVATWAWQRMIEAALLER